MIVRMKHLDLVCVAAEKEATLEKLRALGAVHLDLASAGGASVAAVQSELEDAARAVRRETPAASCSRASPTPAG